MNAPSILAPRGVVPHREESLAPEPSTSGALNEERRGQAQRRDRSSSRPRREPPPTSRLDPRWYQIALLSALLGYGMWLGFGVSWAYVAAVIGTAPATQWLRSRHRPLPPFDPLSALIT